MRYYLIAGEVSGDLLGSHLAKAILGQDPQAQMRYWGGCKMNEAIGTEPVRHIRDLAIMGFVEVVRNLRTVLGNIKCCKQDILRFKPDVVVGIDYPGFNLKIEKFAHQHGIKTVHYVSPQLWAWKKGRIKGMRRNLDRLCYILPFEQQFYAANAFPQAAFVGHPLLDVVAGWSDPSVSNPTADKPIIALLPGSRKQEVGKVLPAMLRLADNHQEYSFAIAGLAMLGSDFYEAIVGNRGNVAVVYDQTYQLLSSAYAALVCSGTATLETALFGLPQVVCYAANPISVAIARRLVGRRIKYISLVNLIADESIITELIQQDFSDERLEQEFDLITNNAANRQRIAEGYSRMRQLLGNEGASERCATQIINTCRK